ncbi:hypothetical protein [Ectothiorhodospira variabilis]|uniref:hypothetical protein n=1 Tax=Ectothiorhodospira variabilis TaxID=505694 RepID=UPI001EFB9574|nr:hypothetical protein [Ectothiorhodospira variabilis]MCG5495576.1 hypothetical protein [Ectothiorhodospira variabilis]MCG5505184.1 hypothetical protein [Ectothiorhodospira variabilis]MCG5508341.1 hypothetical protein [Ectothiorhodospira variabilis]
MGTVSGLLSSHRNMIESQVWFGDSDLARDFANTLGTQLSAPFNWGLGPAFGFEIYDGVGADYTKAWFYKPTNYHIELDRRAQMQNASAGVYYTYAVAEHIGRADVRVPEPSSLMLFLMSISILALIGLMKAS